MPQRHLAGGVPKGLRNHFRKLPGSDRGGRHPAAQAVGADQGDAGLLAEPADLIPEPLAAFAPFHLTRKERIG